MPENEKPTVPVAEVPTAEQTRAFSHWAAQVYRAKKKHNISTSWVRPDQKKGLDK